MNQPVNVVFDKHFLDFVKTKVNKVKFPELCDTTRYLSEPIAAWGIELPENPNSELIKYGLIMGHGNIKPKKVIQVIGGAGEFDPQNLFPPHEIDKILNSYSNNPWIRSTIEIFQAASSQNATILTGGTQSGIMALISSLHIVAQGIYNKSEESLKKLSNFLFQPTKVMEMLKPPQLVHIIPANLTIFPQNKWQISWNKYPNILAPCSGFLTVPGIKDWGNDQATLEETQWWVSYIPTLEKICSVFGGSTNQTQRVTIIFNGGLLTLAEAYSALLNGSKIILIKGSGRLANLLSYLLDNNWDTELLGTLSIEEPRLESDLGKHEYLALLKRFATLAKKKNGVYDSNLGDIGLNSLIEILLSGITPKFIKQKNHIKKKNSVVYESN